MSQTGHDITTNQSNADYAIADGPFTSAWESLRTFQCPTWFRDAKLAFWAHWGPQSVPMFGDWYARHLYQQGHEQYLHHWRVYGHPSQVGYKDIVPLWKAEKFDPDALMSLFVEAGAQYFVAQAVHHDNFDNFNSRHHRWNAVNMGPCKDIVKMWQQAARARHLPFGLTEHLSASFNWFEMNKRCDASGPYAGIPYDGNDPAYADLYYANQGSPMIMPDGQWRWYTENHWFHQHWFSRMKDLIDQYQPDLLYSDGGVPFENFSYANTVEGTTADADRFTEAGRSIVAHLYNTSIACHGENMAVYNQKNPDPLVQSIGVLDIERGQAAEIAELPWQTDTSVGDWFYNVKDVYKTAQHVLDMLVDIVSKNGNLLLNIPQRPDGTLDDECSYLLRQMATWMDGQREGIFASRPWRQAGEGPTNAASGAFQENAVAWTEEDFRFTCKDDTIYAYQMRWPEERQTVIHSLAATTAEPVKSVRLLGHGPVQFTQQTDGLHITLPEVAPSEAPHGFAIDPK